MASTSSEFDRARDPRRTLYGRDRAALDREKRDILVTFEAHEEQAEQERRRTDKASLPDRIASQATRLAADLRQPAFVRTDAEVFLRRATEEGYSPDKLVPKNAREKLLSVAIETVLIERTNEQRLRAEERFQRERHLLKNLRSLPMEKSQSRDRGDDFGP